MLLAVANTARAQLIEQYFPGDIPGYQLDDSASVVNRILNSQQSGGVEYGGFTFYPDLNENAGYNSNTLGKTGSGSTQIESDASIRADSDWTYDSVNAAFNIDDLHYFEVPEANYTNWSASLGGSVDLGNDTASFNYAHDAMHLTATSMGAVGVQTPVPYSVDNVTLSYLKLFGRFSATPDFKYEDFGFGQGGAGDQSNYQTLSHQVENAGLTIRFEAAPGDALVSVVRPSFAQFGKNPADDYSDIAGYAGIDLRGARIIQYRFLIGVEHRSFADHTMQAITTPTFEANAIWTPTELDTLTLTGVHRLDDPTSTFVRDQDLLDGRVELDHALRRNVFLVGYAEGARTNSRAAIVETPNIVQTQLNAGISAIWNFSNHFGATLSYGFSWNEISGQSAPTSSAAGQNFSSSSILIGIRLYG